MIDQAIKSNKRTTNNFFLRQLIFFIPLSITGFLLAFNGTIVNAGLARLPSPALLIASFAVARTFMQLIISPMHMIRPMVTALSRNGSDYIAVKRFAMAITAGVTGILALFALTGGAEWIFVNIMKFNTNIAETAADILKLLILYPLGLYFKDFYHGVLIRFEKTSLITTATVIRILIVSVLAYAITQISFISGIILTGIIYLSGAYSEGLSACLFSSKAIGHIPDSLDNMLSEEVSQTGNRLTKTYIFNFYWPLVATTYIKAVAMPVVNAGLGKTLSPELAISTFAVTWGLIGILNNPMNMFHQVSIRFTSQANRSNNQKVLQFGLVIGLIMSALIMVLSLTPLGQIVFERWIGVNPDISLTAVRILKFAALIPLITVLREYYWGIMIKQGNTKYLGMGKIINVIVLILSIGAVFVVEPQNTPMVAIIAILISSAAELIFILYVYKRKVGRIL